MKTPLSIAAACEAATGLGLVIAPRLVVGLLLGADPSGAGLVMSRVAGIALVGLGLACWPGRDTIASRAPLRAMLAYNLLATLYLLSLGLGGEWVGRLLWAAVVAHAVMSVWCFAVMLRPPAGAAP